MLPRGRVYGAQHGLGGRGFSEMGLSERVVEWKKVLVKHQWGTHVFFFGGGEKQHRWRADDQKVVGRRERDKIYGRGIR